MIAFWAAAGVLSAVAAIIVLLRGARAATLVEPADLSPELYRRQMAEIAELADRGLLGAEERKGHEAEAGRRLLTSIDRHDRPWTSAGHRTPVLAAVIAAPALALAVYLAVGAPGLGDQPFAARLKHWEASDPRTMAPSELAAVLADLARQRPNDPEVFRFLAQAEKGSGNPAGAVRALRRAIKVAPGRADLWEALSEALLMQSGGELTDDARAALDETLRLDPGNVPVRFFLGRTRITAGDKAGGLAAWRALLAEMPPGDPRRTDLQAAIAEAEGAPSGPAAPGLSGDQMAAVRGMVAGLAQRLKASPDDPAGWVRLVRAYAVLGESGPKDAALKEARARFASRPDVLDQLNQAAAAEAMR